MPEPREGVGKLGFGTGESLAQGHTVRRCQSWPGLTLVLNRQAVRLEMGPRGGLLDPRP